MRSTGSVNHQRFSVKNAPVIFAAHNLINNPVCIFAVRLFLFLFEICCSNPASVLFIHSQLRQLAQSFFAPSKWIATESFRKNMTYLCFGTASQYLQLFSVNDFIPIPHYVASKVCDTLSLVFILRCIV